MSGKAYTMKEMKVIVEYVTLKKAFGDVKGRKMWVEFANSNLTVRTWQSLKETFLKRILPDIHNPYYRLTMDQIRSFREGCDVTEKEKNKLEIINLNDEENSDPNENQEPQSNEEPSTSHANGDAMPGEDVTSSKIQCRDRASVDTVIIPTCYETAEDVQRDLESPTSNANDNVAQADDKATPTKSMRDLITYSEPLTPMLQEVLHDFATDEDSDDNDVKMQIMEKANPDARPQTVNEESPTIISDSEPQVDPEAQNVQPVIDIFDSEEITNKSNTVPEEEEGEIEEADFVQPKILSLKLKKRKGGYKIEKTMKSEKASQSENVDKESRKCDQSVVLDKPDIEITEKKSVENESILKEQEVHVATISEKSTSNLSNSADTLLPNNQEALENCENNTLTNREEQNQNEISKTKEIKKKTEHKSKTRKRASSQDVPINAKIKNNLLDVKSNINKKAVSDTDTIKKKSTKNKKEKLKPVFIDKNQVTLQSSKNNYGSKVSEKNLKSNTENEPSSSKVDNSTPLNASQLNPCLKSVSLFAEQFNQVSYIDSESEHEVGTSGKKAKETIEEICKTDKNRNKKNEKVVNIVNEVVILKSHSESETENNEFSPKRKNAPDSRMKSQRDKVLANVFGFSSGTVGKRKRRISYKKGSKYRYPRNDSSADSSEWTSESDSETYVSPPRGRKNRQTRKYLKPQSARVLSLEEEGGLFVMYGKKIYPLVKDGKIVKNYLTYLPESDPEEEESYWKLKYVEERKRVEELKKIMDQKEVKVVRENSPILPAKSLRNMPACHETRSPAKSNKTNTCEPAPVPMPVKERNDEVNGQGQMLKITFARNNQEVHVEGHWSNIHPVLAEVVQIFNNDAEPAKDYRPAGNVDIARQFSDVSSEKSVAVVPVIDKEVREKVNKLETEIFKEIEKLDKEEQQVESKESSETNVTKRKRAPRSKRSASNQSSVAQNSSASSPRSPKRQKISDTNQKEATKQEEQVVEQKPVEKKTVKKSVGKKVSKTVNKSVSNTTNSDKSEEQAATVPVEPKSEENSKETISLEVTNSKISVRTRRQTRSPKKLTPKKDDKVAVTPNTKTVTTRKSKEAVASPSQVEDDDELRYMFPPAKPVRTPRSALSLKTRENKQYTGDPPKTYCSPNISLHSESTQGYQDSDISPPKSLLRRKRKLSLTTALNKIRHRTYRNKRKSYPILTEDISSDSSSSYRIIVGPASEDTSLKSEAYRSDSYQLLFPQHKNVFRPLEKIDEDNPVGNIQQAEKSLEPNYPITKTLDINNDFVISSNGITDGGNSSNVSLPLSPELSIVENLSISKELINSVQKHPNLNEIQANNDVQSQIQNKYMMSQIDVSMPLMEQTCDFHQSFPPIKTESGLDDTKPCLISDSLLRQINIVNIEDTPSLSESLDTRLRNLLLESAKKMSAPSENVKTVTKEAQKKKSGKRCSTPRKKREVNVRKRKLNIADPVVEEECTESCSYGGRNSCPPAIQLLIANDMCKDNVDVKTDKDEKKSKSKRKKDVIKVKILRPRSKTRKEEQVPNEKETSVPNDSGINDTESVISNQGYDSIDLIHNHSETCLHANECLADSVEFIETSARSVISINTDSASGTDLSFRDRIVFKDCEELDPGLFCQNAQDWTNVNVRKPARTNTDNTSETVFLSPVLSDTSLITEDLSDEPAPSQPTKWYLLSEDETQTVNSSTLPNAQHSSFGANLKQIFPITCAVPDLSTITEMSNENSRKPTLESDISSRLDLESESLF